MPVPVVVFLVRQVGAVMLGLRPFMGLPHGLFEWLMLFIVVIEGDADGVKWPASRVFGRG